MAAKGTKKKWSAKVTKTSDALDLENGVFKSKNPEKIAESLKRSAEKSKRRKTTPFQSAMSMLNFYENRAGKNLPKEEKKPLDEAKNKLRKLYGREEK
jgi:polyhydroxyalkanoate synthesis regulator protein